MKIRINRVADDCLAATFNRNDIHLQEKDATIMLEIDDAKGLLFALETELFPIGGER